MARAARFALPALGLLLVLGCGGGAKKSAEGPGEGSNGGASSGQTGGGSRNRPTGDGAGDNDGNPCSSNPCGDDPHKDFED